VRDGDALEVKHVPDWFSIVGKVALVSGGSRVINVGSVDGIKTPAFDNFPYGPSKAALHHLSRVLAAHLIKPPLGSPVPPIRR
jgi:NAD(P)-dependent dehydrogenase (short-subunit alcohol dehydrogenase family)